MKPEVLRPIFTLCLVKLQLVLIQGQYVVPRAGSRLYPSLSELAPQNGDIRRYPSEVGNPRTRANSRASQVRSPGPVKRLSDIRPSPGRLHSWISNNGGVSRTTFGIGLQHTQLLEQARQQRLRRENLDKIKRNRAQQELLRRQQNQQRHRRYDYPSDVPGLSRSIQARPRYVLAQQGLQQGRRQPTQQQQRYHIENLFPRRQKQVGDVPPHLPQQRQRYHQEDLLNERVQRVLQPTQNIRRQKEHSSGYDNENQEHFRRPNQRAQNFEVQSRNSMTAYPQDGVHGTGSVRHERPSIGSPEKLLPSQFYNRNYEANHPVPNISSEPRSQISETIHVSNVNSDNVQHDFLKTMSFLGILPPSSSSQPEQIIPVKGNRPTDSYQPTVGAKVQGAKVGSLSQSDIAIGPLTLSGAFQPPISVQHQSNPSQSVAVSSIGNVALRNQANNYAAAVSAPNGANPSTSHAASVSSSQTTSRKDLRPDITVNLTATTGAMAPAQKLTPGIQQASAVARQNPGTVGLQPGQVGQQPGMMDQQPATVVQGTQATPGIVQQGMAVTPPETSIAANQLLPIHGAIGAGMNPYMTMRGMNHPMGGMSGMYGMGGMHSMMNPMYSGIMGMPGMPLFFDMESPDSPDPTPEAAPKAAPEATPEAAPEAAPEATPEANPAPATGSPVQHTGAAAVAVPAGLSSAAAGGNAAVTGVAGVPAAPAGNTTPASTTSRAASAPRTPTSSPAASAAIISGISSKEFNALVASLTERAMRVFKLNYNVPIALTVVNNKTASKVQLQHPTSPASAASTTVATPQTSTTTAATEEVELEAEEQITTTAAPKPPVPAAADGINGTGEGLKDKPAISAATTTTAPSTTSTTTQPTTTDEEMAEEAEDIAKAKEATGSLSASNKDYFDKIYTKFLNYDYTV